MNSSPFDGFFFRNLGPGVYMGTASDRYAGWIGQIYSERRYRGEITGRRKTVGGVSYLETVLPVSSVEEYFRHFGVLELDFTFYRMLLDANGVSTPTVHLLRRYTEHLGKDDRLVIKVPQSICARNLRRGGGYVVNDEYLDARVFTERFYAPAVGLLGPWLHGFVFEQEYRRAKDRGAPGEIARELDAFFSALPGDTRYHMELRTESYLSPEVFEVFERHGVGQVLSHWTWLPPLMKQFGRSGRRFLNSGRGCIVRLMTPRGMRYEDAYARAHPFDGLVDGMVDPLMVEETASVMKEARRQGVEVQVIVNNRSGGNAPLVAREIAHRFRQVVSQ